MCVHMQKFVFTVCVFCVCVFVMGNMLQFGEKEHQRVHCYYCDLLREPSQNTFYPRNVLLQQVKVKGLKIKTLNLGRSTLIVFIF